MEESYIRKKSKAGVGLKLPVLALECYHVPMIGDSIWEKEIYKYKAP